MEREERYRARVERKTAMVPTEPWLCSQLLLALALLPLLLPSYPAPITLRILLYLPVCRPSILHLPAVFEVAIESRAHRIYFIKPFSVLPPAKVPRSNVR